MCKYITVCPKWYKDESTELKHVTNQNIPILSSEQDVSSENVSICKYIYVQDVYEVIDKC